MGKLIATLVLILLALGIFVGGEKFVSYLDRASGPRPPTATPAKPDSVPHTAVEFGPAPAASPGDAPTERAAPPVAVLTDPTQAPPPRARPTRGALRPSLDAPVSPPARPVPHAAPAVAAAPTRAAENAQPAAERPRPVVEPAADAPPRPAAEPVRDPVDVPAIQETPAEAAAPPPRTPVPLSDDLEPVILDLQIGRLVSRTVAAYRQGEAALVPLATFFELAEIGFTPPHDGVFEARLEPGGQNIRIELGADSLSIGSRRVAVGTANLVERDGEMFLATAPLGEMLKVDIQVSWPDLAVTVLNPDSLPVARRYWRDQMRALLAERYGARPDTTLGLPRSKWDGMVLDYSVSFPYSNNLVGGASYAFAAGAQAAGGGLEIGVRSLGTLDAGAAEFAATWKGVWIDNTYVKQLTLGTTTLTGPRFTGMHGVAVTNSPYVRPTYVGQLDYYGRLDPGWQLEAYSGSQLVAFDSIGPSGDYTISLPVGYGENPVDFVAYGPNGQVRRFNQTYRVVSEQLPYRQFEYGVAAGVCVSAICDGALNADLHYGLSRRVTVRGGVEGYSRDDGHTLVHPYGVVTGLVGNAVTLEAEAIGNGWLRGAARFEPSLDFRLAAGYSTFDTSVDRPVIAPAGRRSQWIFDGFVRPIRSISSFYLQAAAEIDDGVDLDMSRARVQASVQVDMVRLYPYVRFERFVPTSGEATSAEFVGLSAYMNGRPSWGSALGALWFRGDLEAGDGGINFAAATVARSFGPALRIEGGAAWRSGNPGTIFTLSLVSYLPTVQATTTAIAPTVGEGGVAQTLQGAVIYDNHQGRVTASPNAGIQRSGVSGTVFFDENANGEQDPGESGVSGVRVVVGSSAMTTDSAGRYHVWDIAAFEPVQVQIDSTSLINPLYVPAFNTASVQPPPNAYRNLDLPLVTGAVLEGRVVRDGAPLPGVTLVLTNTGNGKRTSIATFSDGSFYVLGVKPGQYTLEVDSRDLSARRLVGTTLRLTAQPGAPDQLSNLLVEARSQP